MIFRGGANVDVEVAGELARLLLNADCDSVSNDISKMVRTIPHSTSPPRFMFHVRCLFCHSFIALASKPREEKKKEKERKEKRKKRKLAFLLLLV